MTGATITNSVQLKPGLQYSSVTGVTLGLSHKTVRRGGDKTMAEHLLSNRRAKAPIGQYNGNVNEGN